LTPNFPSPGSSDVTNLGKTVINSPVLTKIPLTRKFYTKSYEDNKNL